MKKIIYITVVLILITLVLSLNSCSNNEVILLTSENFQDYFIINSYIENYTKEKNIVFTANCIFKIEIIPITNLKVENLKIKAMLNSSSWSSADIYEENGNSYIDITVPYTGMITKTVQCSYSNFWEIYPNAPSISSFEVTGTITK